ncbi:ketoacyl-ACP synthase III [Pseudomonas aeruginosa]
MATSTLKNVRFAGMATCVPKRVISNLTDCKPQLRAERERLVRNIGIETRRMAQEWQCFSDLAFDAAERLLESLEWKREEVDALIVVTQSPDYLAPATAIILQDRLGLPHSTVAFDVNLGCSAYPFALNLLGSLIAAGGVKKGLVLVGVQHLMPFREDENDHWHRAIDLQLDGTAVLSFSTQRVPPAVEKLLDYAGASKDEVDYFVFHQANRMINETIRKKLGLPVEKVPSTLRDFGNTSGASLPVTMTARINRELEAGRNRVLLCGFGIGLSWGTCLVDIEGAKFPDLIES